MAAAMSVASRLSARTASPGSTSGRNTTRGSRRTRAATLGGKLPYPPVLSITFGTEAPQRSQRRRHAQCRTREPARQGQRRTTAQRRRRHCLEGHVVTLHEGALAAVVRPVETRLHRLAAGPQRPQGGQRREDVACRSARCQRDSHPSSLLSEDCLSVPVPVPVRVRSRAASRSSVKREMLASTPAARSTAARALPP